MVKDKRRRLRAVDSGAVAAAAPAASTTEAHYPGGPGGAPVEDPEAGLAARLPQQALVAQRKPPWDFIPAGTWLWMPTEAGPRLAIIRTTRHAGGAYEWATEAEKTDYTARLRAHHDRLRAQQKAARDLEEWNRFFLGIVVVAAHEVRHDPDLRAAAAPEALADAHEIVTAHPLPIVAPTRVAAVVPAPPARGMAWLAKLLTGGG